MSLEIYPENGLSQLTQKLYFRIQQYFGFGGKKLKFES